MKYYLYCFCRSSVNKKFGKIGMEEEEVFTISYKDISAVVSMTGQKIFDPLREHLFNHQKVVSTVMKNQYILPVSFGTVLNSKEDVIQMMENLYSDLIESLGSVENRIEVGLKIFWTKEIFQKEMEKVDPDIARLKRLVRETKTGSKYEMIISLGEKVESAANKKREEYKNIIHEFLKQIAVDSKINNITNEKMIINASYLVDKDKETEFDEAVNEIYRKYCDDFEFKYTGPWPPYNFVNISEKE